MQSTFTGIEIGKRGLGAHNQGLVTIGHNLANASTEGYSRQRIVNGTVEPLYAPALNRAETPGQVGQGVQTQRIERIKDEILEGRIVGQAGLESYWSERSDWLLQLEEINNEPSESSVRGLMDRFWDSWQELSLRPDDLAARQAVLSRGEALAEGVRDRHRRLSELRSAVDGDLRGQVERVNELSRDIANLNGEIVRSKALGDSPNDLMDRRDLLVEELGKLVELRVDGRDKDELMLHVEGVVLVQGRIARPLEMRGADEEGFASPVWAETGLPFATKAGSLGALMELRDGDVRSQMQDLDAMALSFADLVNENHRAGYGLDGTTGKDFFREWPLVNNLAGNYDRNGDGTYDSSYVYRMTGSNPLTAREQIGLRGTLGLSGKDGLVEVPYYPTDTVADLVARVNSSGAEVGARLDREGRLQLRALPAADRNAPSFAIRHVEDSGQFLAGYAGLLRGPGAEGAYDWAKADAVIALTGGADYGVAPISRPAAWLELSPALAGNPGALAAGFGAGGRPAEPGDGSAARAIASLRTESVMVGGGGKTFDDHFAESVARIGLEGERAERASESHARIAKDLRDLRQSISGVNMDEELAEMIKFQQGYAAAAKFVTQIDQMLDTIINRMGV